MHYMNRQRGRHMGAHDEQQSGDHQGKPDIHIKSHAKGHTVHVMHQDGAHEKFEHDPGDTEGMAEHVHNFLGGGAGSGDHGSENEQLQGEDLGAMGS
jgi:hypothetical protein